MTDPTVRSNAAARLAPSRALPLGVLLGLALGACDKPPPAPRAGDAPVEAQRDAELAERERALAAREAAVAAQEQQTQQADQAAATAAATAEAEARGKAEAAALAQAKQRQAVAERRRLATERAAARAEAEATRERAARAETTRQRGEAATARAAAAARPIEVPAGTRLAVSLKQALSSKTAQTGERFEAVLTSDVVAADGRVAVPAGATVVGTITDVVSGSRNIGATPAIGLRFEHLVTADGQRIPISGELGEQGASERGRDTAKILGGAAAGAVLGHQVRNDDRGKVLGGLLGGAIGAVAAKKTGTEVALADGAPLTITLGAPLSVMPAGTRAGG
jgi:type IV secretory pathway VirB10-like protein